MMRRVCLFFAVLVLMSTAFAFGQASNPTNPTYENRPSAPDFSVTSLRGEKFELAALRGKIVVLNLWFVGCQPCLEEMPRLNGLVDKFRKKDVVFIAPTWDDVSTLQAFLKEHPFKYHVVPNARELILASYHDGTGKIVFPRHLVIDKEGKIDTTIDGPEQLEDLRRAIARLIKTPSGKAN